MYHAVLADKAQRVLWSGKIIRDIKIFLYSGAQDKDTQCYYRL